MSSPDITVEIVFAEPDCQRLLQLSVPAGSTVADVIAASRIKDHFPGIDFSGLSVGIWSREVSLSQTVAESDRIEIYRPLALDPRDARRQLAASGRTMGDSGS